MATQGGEVGELIQIEDTFSSQVGERHNCHVTWGFLGYPDVGKPRGQGVPDIGFFLLLFCCSFLSFAGSVFRRFQFELPLSQRVIVNAHNNVFFETLFIDGCVLGCRD